MKREKPLDDSIRKAVETIRHFINETTGKTPSDEEIADALKRYFVLNEIKAQILMDREQRQSAGKN